MSIASKHQVAVATLLALNVWLVVHLGFWLLPHVFEPWNARMADQLFRLRAAALRLRPPYDDTIVHIDLNDSSVRRLGTFYLDRSHYTQVIRNLHQMGVAAQAYDFIFAAQVNQAQDQAFMEATAEADTVYFGLAFALHRGEAPRQSYHNPAVAQYLERTAWQVRSSGDLSTLYRGTKPLPTFPELAVQSQGLGFLSIKADRDGVLRRVPLLVRYGEAFYPSLPFRVVCDYLSVSPDKISLHPGKHIILHDARRPGEATTHDIVIPIDRFGNMVINYIGPWERMRHYSFADVLHASHDPAEFALWAAELAGRLVLISDVSTGAAEVAPVPTDVSYPLSGLHTSVIHTILTENFLRELSLSSTLIIEGVLLVSVLVLALTSSSWSFALGTLALTLGYLGTAAVGFFSAHLIFSIVRPLLIVVFTVMLLMAYRYLLAEKAKEALRTSFEHYFPPTVVKKLMANPIMFGTGEKKELTILFSDIENFTAHTETLDPVVVQHLLNEYFEAMTEVVFTYQGTLDKFMGDGLMVFFGDPELQPDHAVRCVRAAIDMQHKVRELQAQWEKRGYIPWQVRIGINTGVVAVGNMGSARRLSYTAIGPAVNLAQRLQTQAPVGGILITQRTYDLTKEHIAACPLGSLPFKGFAEPIAVYTVAVDGWQDSQEASS